MFLGRLFKSAIENIVLRFWSQEEKEALLRILHEIYNCDHEFSAEEVKDFNDRLRSLNVDYERIKALPIEDAVRILHEDKLKKDIIYLVLAEAIFKDEDFDSIEKIYIDNFVQKYSIDKERLKEKIKEVRDRKFEEALRGWIKEIEEKSPEGVSVLGHEK